MTAGTANSWGLAIPTATITIEGVGISVTRTTDETVTAAVIALLFRPGTSAPKTEEPLPHKTPLPPTLTGAH